MEQSGGRRIKRALLIDMSSVRFLSVDEIEQFSRFKPLRKYMAEKLGDIEHYNTKYTKVGDDEIGDPRRLTNLGTLRAYMLNYLKSHPMLETDKFTCLVRQLSPTPHGLPLEIYTFLSGTDWGLYEAVQADIFDHLLSMLSKFDLRVYQQGLLEGLATQGVTLYNRNEP
jgi:miniconductance mechanosensitive channel